MHHRLCRRRSRDHAYPGSIIASAVEARSILYGARAIKYGMGTSQITEWLWRGYFHRINVRVTSHHFLRSKKSTFQNKSHSEAFRILRVVPVDYLLGSLELEVVCFIKLKHAQVDRSYFRSIDLLDDPPFL